MERGCFSCETLIIPESKDGLHFWKKRLGESRIQSLINEPRQRSHELIFRLNRIEMKENYEKHELTSTTVNTAVSPNNQLLMIQDNEANLQSQNRGSNDIFNVI